MTVVAVVLDLDGVILKTNRINYRALLSLFAAYPDQQPRISDYILAHGGIPRRENLLTTLRDLLQTPPTAALLTHDLQRYAGALEDELAVTPLVEDIETFLATIHCGVNTTVVSKAKLLV